MFSSFSTQKKHHSSLSPSLIRHHFFLRSLSPTDRLSDQGVVACGRSSRRDPDPFLSVRDGDGTRPPAEIQSVHAAAQKQSKKCLLPMLHCHFFLHSCNGFYCFGVFLPFKTNIDFRFDCFLFNSVFMKSSTCFEVHQVW